MTQKDNISLGMENYVTREGVSVDLDRDGKTDLYVGQFKSDGTYTVQYKGTEYSSHVLVALLRSDTDGMPGWMLDDAKNIMDAGRDLYDALANNEAARASQLSEEINVQAKALTYKAARSL